MEINKTSQRLAALERVLSGDPSEVVISEIGELCRRVTQATGRAFEKLPASRSDLKGRVQESEDERVAELASRLFGVAMEKKEELYERDVRILPALSDLDRRVTELWLGRDGMEPEALEAGIRETVARFDGLEEPTAPELRAKMEGVKKKVQDMIFEFQFPVIRELDGVPGSFAHNLIGEG